MFSILLLILCVIFIIISTVKWKLHPFLSLLVAAFLFGLFSSIPANEVIMHITRGFGETIGKVGIIIIAGVIIGSFLENSGGAYALANKILKLIGEKRIHTAMAFIGYIISVPVFCDSGFILLSSLNKALTKKAGVSLAGTAIALSLGLLATHTMVPPTPGPVAAAGILKADIGMVMIIGLIVSLLSLGIALLFIKFYASKITIDPGSTNIDETKVVEKQQKAPSSFKSLLPIIVPIILIVMKSVSTLPSTPLGEEYFFTTVNFLGNPVIALFIGVILSLLLPQKLEKKMLSIDGWVGKALRNAAIIILITGAGGAFGSILQNSELSVVLQNIFSGSSMGLWLPFLIAAALKTAQGSSTVAIITTASMMFPLLEPMGIDTGIEKAMTVVAIGAGANVVSHANDSFFWVVTQLSNMDVKNGYKLQSLGSGVMGISAMLFLWLISLLV